MSVTCLICKTTNVDVLPLTEKREGVRNPITCNFTICRECSYISNPSNTHSYDTADSIGASSRPSEENKRVGDGTKPGREYFMFNMCNQILGRTDLDVLFFGAVLSRDYALARKSNNVRKTTTADFGNFVDSDDFVSLNENSLRRFFDIVIACEVIEHFTNPIEEFGRLFGFVKSDGIVVCSTNIHDGRSVDTIPNLVYPYIKGHTSYYSGQSIQKLSEFHGMQFDFRLPKCAQGNAGPRKRYVLFYRQPQISQNIAVFFSKYPFAPSEVG